MEPRIQNDSSKNAFFLNFQVRPLPEMSDLARMILKRACPDSGESSRSPRKIHKVGQDHPKIFRFFVAKLS